MCVCACVVLNCIYMLPILQSSAGDLVCMCAVDVWCLSGFICYGYYSLVRGICYVCVQYMCGVNLYLYAEDTTS